MNRQSTALDYEDHIKDLGVIFDEKLDFSVHIAETINEAYRLLWHMVTIPYAYAYGKLTITVCPCWPASTTNQSSLVTLTFDLESGVQVTCDVGYLCANFGLPRPLCSRLRPDVCDRQRDRRQTSDSIIA